MICTACLTHIQPGQLYIGRPIWRWRVGKPGPIHVACPAPERIAHCKRMGRPL